ncbi:MAG: hypothetical protein IT410_02465 [Candidatus Doudnabacteria bacterium]|nr:hypothetical protein [Candidatus Doudnabacteria bacterium]
MPKSSAQKRAIDQKVGVAERDLRSAFAFVAKKRANIWFTAAGVLFVLGIAFAFLTVGDSAMQGNAAFLRASTSAPNRTATSGTASVPVPLHPSYSDPTTGIVPSGVSGSTATPTTRVANPTTGTTSGNTPTVGINNTAGNPYADYSRDCSWKRPDQCAVTIEAATSSVQGQQMDFKVYATPQVKQCGPGDPGYIAGNPNSCQYILMLWPSVQIDWGDGSKQSSSIRTAYKHAYLTAGTYTVTVNARYNRQQFFSPDGSVTPIESYNIAPVTKTITVTAASSAVLRTSLNSGSRPAGAVSQNARAVEFAKIDITNPTSSVKTLNAVLIGCKDGYAPQRNNGTAAPQPFASNKFFTVQSTSGGGQAVTFSSAREFFGMFPGAQFQFDSQLLLKCMGGAFRAGARSGNSAITVPANGTTTVSLIADVGQVDPCTRLQLGIMAGYEGGGSGPLIANSTMGNLQIVPGTNPLTGETCTAATVGGSGAGATGGSASAAAASKTPASTGTSGTKGTQTSNTGGK